MSEVIDSARLRELRRLENLRRVFKLLMYKPYPKQRAFDAMGLTKRERAFLAGTQLGKTLAASYEVAMHLTGFYPDWWEGIRFNEPVRVGIGSINSEESVAQYA